MATSPIYGWAEPDNTDLVKNGALAIRTLGNAIDTTMGTMVAKTIIDAKGDLIAGSAADTALRLAVGNNGETLVADSSTSTGLRYTENYAAGKNAIINGAFNVNQRNFTSATADGSYGFDRWLLATSTGTTYTAQTFTAGTAPVAGYEGTNFAQLTTVGQSASSDLSILIQKIEDVRTLANQTVTISFWAKAASGAPKVSVEIKQGFGSGGSADVNTYAGQVTLTTSWARYSVGVAVPSISGKTIGTSSSTQLFLWTSAGSTYNSRTNSLGIQNSTIAFWGVQVEDGSVATAFQTATGTIQGELAACQRYYWRDTGASNSPTIPVSYQVNSATIGGNNPVVMRVAPSVSTTYQNANYGSAWNLSQPTRAASTKTGSVSNNFFSTPLTWGLCFDGGTFSPSPSAFQGSASNYFEASAEL